MKIKNLLDGSIIWKDKKILGIKGITLDKIYYNELCFPLENSFDYEIYIR